MSEKRSEKSTWWQVVVSTLAAAFGVQSTKNRERDFKQGQVKTFIIAGVIFTAAVVLILSFIVAQVVKYAAN